MKNELDEVKETVVAVRNKMEAVGNKVTEANNRAKAAESEIKSTVKAEVQNCIDELTLSLSNQVKIVVETELAELMPRLESTVTQTKVTHIAENRYAVYFSPPLLRGHHSLSVFLNDNIIAGCPRNIFITHPVTLLGKIE